MAFSIEQLRSKSDAELISLHDSKATHTSVGINYFLDELRRREQVAMMRSNRRLSIASLILAGANVLVAGAAVAIALIYG